MPPRKRGLTVAVTGPTGTFGFGLIPQLQADERVARIVGIARRPFDPAGHGWAKMTYHRGDVREASALRDAFGRADVVVHLAFLVSGAASAETIRAVNVDGTLNAFRAAAASGARRFVYASSVAAYGFHPDNPAGMTEDWPVRADRRLFYARHKAELERLLQAEAAGPGTPELYLLRPSIVLGPHVIGEKSLLPGFLAGWVPQAWGRGLTGWAARSRPGPRSGSRCWCRRFRCSSCTKTTWGRRCGSAWSRPGHLGPTTSPPTGCSPQRTSSASSACSRCRCRPRPRTRAARAVAALPFLPPAAQWLQAVSRPAIMDTTRAKRDLGWSPRYTALEALRDTVQRL